MKNLKKNLKISLTTILTAILLTVATGVYAYTGIGDVDPQNTISMPNKLTEGAGSVSGISGTMEYQFVEITESKYNAVKKLEAQYELISVYVEYAANPTDEGLTTKWNTACEKYENAYNETVTDVLNTYGIGPDILTLCRNAWIVELTEYNSSNWKTATDNKISIDLTTFEGTKYYIAWIKTGDILDAEVYVVTGTGTVEEPTEEPKQEEPKEENKVVENNNKDNTPATTTKKDTTASSSGKVIPKTGVSSTILGLIAAAGTSAGISYRKYRKIK